MARPAARLASRPGRRRTGRARRWPGTRRSRPARTSPASRSGYGAQPSHTSPHSCGSARSHWPRSRSRRSRTRRHGGYAGSRWPPDWLAASGGAAVANAAERVDRGFVGLVERAEVLLSGHDAGATDAFLHDLKVRSPGQHARGVAGPWVHAVTLRLRVRILANASSAVSSASGKVCKYFSVVEMLPCPRRSFTVWRSAPPASSQDA